MTVYQFDVRTLGGEKVSLSNYKDQVLLIVNTASKCQFTYQFSQLQAVYDQYKTNNFKVLGFPCNQFDEQEPGTGEEVEQFCQRNYGVTFPMFGKIEVNGKNESSLFRYLKQEAPFHGFDESDITQKLLKMKLEENYPQWVVGDAIKWNFTKFLIGRTGKVIHRFEPFEEPETFKKEIETLL